MRRFIRILIPVLLGASAIVFGIACFITYQSFNNDPVFEFALSGMRWEMAGHDGILWLDNQPQRRIEQADFDARTADLQPGLHQSWGSDEWRVRLNYFQKLEREQAAVATPLVAHTMPMLPVNLSLSVAPIIGCIAWLRRHPAARKRVVQFAYVATGTLALMICVFSTAMWIRSRWKDDLVSKPTRWHYYKAAFGDRGVVLQKFRIVRRTQRVLLTLVRSQNGLRFQEQMTPAGVYTDAAIRYIDSDLVRQRLSPAELQSGRGGEWRWRSASLAPPYAHSQITWVKQKLPFWPTVLPASNSFGGRMLGRPSTPLHTREETELLGHTLWLPYWFLIAVTGPASCILLRAAYNAHRSRKRSNRGQCKGCGYDIRATPERCPECGLAVSRTGSDQAAPA